MATDITEPTPVEPTPLEKLVQAAQIVATEAGEVEALQNSLVEISEQKAAVERVFNETQNTVEKEKADIKRALADVSAAIETIRTKYGLNS